jgi:hypothetical protein
MKDNTTSADKNRMYYDLGPTRDTQGNPGRLLQIADGNARCIVVTTRRYNELKRCNGIQSSSNGDRK